MRCFDRLQSASSPASAGPPRACQPIRSDAILGHKRIAFGAASIAFCAALAVGSHTGAAAQGLAPIAPLDASRPITYFIAGGTPGSHFRPGDKQLARWALMAWQRKAGGALHFVAAPQKQALVRVYWVPASAGEYGETRPFELDGRRGAAAFIRPDMAALGPKIARLAAEDPLFRDTVVYLTCLHELGHALGLVHTHDYHDIMYFFGFGGGVVRYFERYRKRLHSRGDIARISGIAPGDLKQLRALYPVK